MSSWSHPPNHDNRAPSIIATAVVLIVVSTAAVSVRFWSRLVAARIKFWWDDAALLATLIFSHAYLATLIWWTTVGYGQHMWMIPMSNIKANMLASHLIVLFYVSAINFLKLSALALYGRLFRVSQRMVWALWTIAALVIMWWISCAVTNWLDCHPVQKTLDPMIPGTCVERIGYYRAVGLINPLLDILILLLPMPILWKLNMSSGRKMLNCLVFLLGYCSAIFSFVRFGIIFERPDILSAGEPDSDPTWDTVPLQIITMLEAPIGILALSGPPIYQISQRVKQFGWHSLLSTSRLPTPAGKHDSGRSGSVNSDSKTSMIRKKSSATEMPQVPPLSAGGEGMEKSEGRVEVMRDYNV